MRRQRGDDAAEALAGLGDRIFPDPAVGAEIDRSTFSVSSMLALVMALNIAAFLSCAARAAWPKRGICTSVSTALASCSAMNIRRHQIYHCGVTPAR